MSRTKSVWYLRIHVCGAGVQGPRYFRAELHSAGAMIPRPVASMTGDSRQTIGG
jgi:hypothetical protein